MLSQPVGNCLFRNLALSHGVRSLCRAKIIQFMLCTISTPIKCIMECATCSPSASARHTPGYILNSHRTFDVFRFRTSAPSRRNTGRSGAAVTATRSFIAVVVSLATSDPRDIELQSRRIRYLCFRNASPQYPRSSTAVTQCRHCSCSFVELRRCSIDRSREGSRCRWRAEDQVCSHSDH